MHKTHFTITRARFLSMVEQGLSQWEKLYICNVISWELAQRLTKKRSVCRWWLIDLNWMGVTEYIKFKNFLAAKLFPLFHSWMYQHQLNHGHLLTIAPCCQSYKNGFLAATKQLYEWFSPSVCPSVCLSVRPSVCHTFLTMFPSLYHHEIFRSYYQWQKWRPCKRSRSEVKGQGHRGHNPT